jgi:hypothetical protein
VNRSLRLLAALSFVALPSVAGAQAITGSIAASADIATVFSFGTSTGLSFGTVTPGSGATGSGSIALSRNVGDIYSLPDNLQPTYTCGVGATAATIVSSFTSCVPASTTASQLTLGAPSGTLTEYVIFNGSLAAAQTNIAPGTYSGTIRVTATPN